MINKLLLAIFLLTVFLVTAPAQANPEQAIMRARDQFSDIKNRSMELERMKREANRRPVNESATLNFSLIKEDFEQIQKINNDLVLQSNVKSPIDYAFVSKSASDIHHRADRLRSNLFPAEPDEKKEAKNKQQASESEELKSLLDILDRSVNSFAHSPIFQNIKIVNTQDSLRAQKELKTVIEISSLIKEKVKNLKKNDSKK